MFGTKNFLLRTLQFSQKFTFTNTTKEVQSRLNRITEKARLKQTAVDMKKLQGYLEQTKNDKSLNQVLTRTAKYDEEFNSFLKQYKEKNKEFANILDLSHYTRDQNLSKTQKMREEEIMMLEEFRKRKQDKTLYLDSDDEDAGGKIRRKKKSEIEDEDDEGRVIEKGRFSRNSMAKDVKMMTEKILEDRLEALYNKESFLTLILDRGVTTNVTTLNRVNHFRYLVFMGNCNGVIGYGTGQGGNFEIALTKALRNCKKNLIALSLDHFNTLTATVDVFSNGMRFYLEPREDMNAWGNPVMATMLMLCGITHCRFKLTSRNPDPYNYVYCLFKAVTKLATPKDVAEGMGFKIHHQSLMPYRYYSTPRGEVRA